MNVRPTLLAALLLFLIGAPASAAAAEAERQRLILPVVVNQVRQGEMVVLLDGDDVLLSRDNLEKAGIRGIDAQHLEFEGQPYISLKSLAPLVEFELDEMSFVLRITARPELLGTSKFDLGRNPDNLQLSSSRSAFLNYALNSNRFRSLGFAAELGGTWDGKLATTTLSWSDGGTLRRGLSQLIIDRPGSMQRWTFGDSPIATLDPLSGFTTIGGVTVSKNFSLQPYFSRYPAYDFEGVATLPSEVDIYVDGMLRDRRRVAPGQFQLENLPVTSGRGDVRIVVRDPFGREQVHESDYYYSTLLLEKGLDEYSYSLGFRRDRLDKSFDYGDPAFAGFHRRGLREDLTVGARLEASTDVVSAGLSGASKFSFGEVELTLAGSHAEGTGGVAGSAAYRYSSRRFNVGVATSWQSEHYANLSLEQDDDRAAFSTSIFASRPFGLATVGVRLATEIGRENPDRSRVTVSYDYPLRRRMNLSVNAGQEYSDGRSSANVYVGVSFYVGRTIGGSASVSTRGDETDASIEVQKPLPVGEGFGYRMQARSFDGRTDAHLLGRYNHQVAHLEASVDPTRFDETGTISARGGLILIGGRLIPARPVQQSFAMVRVRGVPNVRVYSSNLEVGRTDENGELLIPALLAYYGNRIRIDDRDIPFHYQVEKVEELVAPTFRSGALIEFPVKRIQSVAGNVTMVGPEGDLKPVYGEIVVEHEGERIVSPIGNDGEFYLEQISEGSHPARVEYKGRFCSFALEVPASNEAIIRMGELRCTIE